MITTATAWVIVLMLGSTGISVSPYNFATEKACIEFGDKWSKSTDRGWFHGRSEQRSYQCMSVTVGEPFVTQERPK